MIVDTVSQQQLSEVFNSKRTTMTNGYRYSNELGKKAELILGHATAVVDYRRQFSSDFASPHQFRLNIPETKARSNTRPTVSVEQLVPLIFKLVQPINYTKIPDRISKVNLTDDENDEPELENTNDESTEMDLNTFSLQSFLPSANCPSPIPNIAPSNQRKEDLIRSFSSSVNTPIDIKQPKLPITIPTHLFFEQTKTSSKRDVNECDSMINQPKKSKTSHNAFQIDIKSESNISLANTPTTIPPLIAQIKKEKPTANVKPLQQSSTVDNVATSNVVNTPDRSVSTRVNYANLRNKSTRELNALARDKKKQADGEKRTFDDVKNSMTLYLESVCYYIQCANDEPIVKQRYSLLKETLTMLQHLTLNYPKMFQLPGNQSADLLNDIRPKFLLIDYWLQSYIYHLQFNINFSSIERCANQVIEQIKQPNSPTSNSFYEFSKYMLNAYQSNVFWQKAECLLRDEPCKNFLEQLTRQISPRRLSRDDPTLDFLLYIFEAIELLRITAN